MRRLAELAGPPFDVLIVGGGILGAGIARDAARRGLRTALIEQEDFGCGTSSRPSRLIHGGLRYLERFHFGLVRTDLREREILLRVAPHLVIPLPFLLPMYRRGPLFRAKLRAGMQLYDWLSFDKSLPPRQWLPRGAALAAEPALNADRLQGAWRFYDAQVPLVERLVMENVLDAAAHGACVVNHVRARGWLREGTRVVGAQAEDRIGGRGLEIRAALTINATGPWLDLTAAPWRDRRRPLLRLAKGIHLVTPSITQNAHVLFAGTDQRLFFVLPWLGYSLVGTTDTDFSGDPTTAAAAADDVGYLLQAVRQAFPAADLEVHYALAGIRSLARVESLRPGQVPRKHTLVDHGRQEGVPGVLSVIGGKLTAYRAIAEEVVDWACARLHRPVPADTMRSSLPGAGIGDPRAFRAELFARARALGLEEVQGEHLVRVYGARSAEVLALAQGTPALRARLHPGHPDIAAQVVHAVEREWAVTLSDFLLRRSPLGLMADQALGPARQIAGRMGELLRWDSAEQERQVERYREVVGAMRRFSGKAGRPEAGD